MNRRLENFGQFYERNASLWCSEYLLIGLQTRSKNVTISLLVGASHLELEAGVLYLLFYHQLYQWY